MELGPLKRAVFVGFMAGALLGTVVTALVVR